MSRIGNPPKITAKTPRQALDPQTSKTQDTQPQPTAAQASDAAGAPLDATPDRQPPTLSQRAAAAAAQAIPPKITAETKADATEKFRADVTAGQLQGKLQSQAHADAVGDTIGTAGAARPKTSTFATKADAVAAMKRDFGINVKDGTKSWTTEELSRMHEAYSRMSPADRKQLKGLDLIRDATAPAAVQAKMKEGTVAGLYSPNVDTKGGVRKKPASITMYDAAFPKGDAKASRRTSIHVALHEAGHAVAGRARDEAMAKSNAAVDVSNAAVEKFNAANEANNRSIGDYNDAIKDANRSGPRDRAWGRVMRAQNKVAHALSQLGKASTPAAKKKAEAALSVAKKARDAALRKLPADHGARAELDELKASGDAWETTARSRATTQIDWKAKDAVTRKAKAALDALNNRKNESKHLRAFKEFRAASKEAPISDYGKTSPSEDFAEVYGLYRRDPAALRKNFPKAYAWMKKHHP